ncbi:MAG: class IV adenylate cyclase [Pyrinomonadaceae bacterium]|nr:class IV adenylate cyclase [Pyrinomonadaceae bacterium]
MGIEIEKKYRLSRDEQSRLRDRMRETGAEKRGEDFEENTLYSGANLDPQSRVLRLRRTARATTLTYKERFHSQSAIKHQREDETRVEDADSMHSILLALGFSPALVYEKRRETWRVRSEAGTVEVVIDELPFGSFVEIEGEEKSIIEVERMLNLNDAEAELATYPDLTRALGTKRGELIEARFS